MFNSRQYRNYYYEQHDRQKIFINIRYHFTQIVPSKSQAKSPDKSSDDVIDHKRTIVHIANASYNWGKRTNYWDKSCYHDSLFSIFFVKRLSFYKILFVKKE